MGNKKIRVLVAKPGLDGHDRGVKVVARSLRDAGLEVIYTGLHQTPNQVVEVALQKDIDVIGISVLSGAHMTLVPEIRKMLNENDMNNVLFLVGGIIPEDDAEELISGGFADQIFNPGHPLDKIANYIYRRHLKYEGF